MQGIGGPTILFAHPSAELYGADLQLLQTVKGSVQRGANVVVTLPTRGPLVRRLLAAGSRVLILDVPVLRKAYVTPGGIARLGVRAVRALHSAIRLIRHVSPDVLVVNTQITPLWPLVGRVTGTPVVSHVHEAEADAAPLVRLALALPLRLAHTIVANSRATESVLVGSLASLTDRSRVIYNGVAGGPHGPGPLRAPDTTYRVLLVGRLSPRKGSDVALDAVADLRREGRDVRLTLCGGVFDGYEWFERELRARAEREDLDGAVTFAGYSDPWQHLEDTDVVVVPSRVEPFGNVAVEGMLARRPVIATRTQGLAEIVEHGTNGLQVPAGDAASLASALRTLADDHDLARRLAERGRQDAVARFSPERYDAEMWEAIEGAAESRRPLGTVSIAMVGTRGVPARYGGFETAVEEIGRRLVAQGHRVRVYAREGNSDEPLREYLGMEVVTLPALRRRSLETLSHTALSLWHLLRHRCDAAFVFNAANAPLLPLLRARRIPVATHVDGLEWRRAKWGRGGRKYYRIAEQLAVRWSDALIADAQGIADYYTESFRAPTELIAYGAPRTVAVRPDKLDDLDLRPEGFHLLVARFEPENHVQQIVAGYVGSAASLPLVVVGSAPYADEYTESVRKAAGADPRVRLLGGVWDQELLDELYCGALTYLHGHSVGGTNPSLLRAIGAGTATIAFDVSFNREVLGIHGRYFTEPAQVGEHLEAAESDLDDVRRLGAALAERAGDYDWDRVAEQYAELARRLSLWQVAGPRSSKRRPSSFDE